jgi:predicted glycosyltransferase involved in capsule biosynthesis
VNIVRRRKKKFDLNDFKYYSLEGLIKKDYFFENGNVGDSPINIHYGGFRNKLFGLPDLCLTKHPLILNDGKTKRGRFGHLLLSGRPADFSAVLFHYKFTDDFFTKTQAAVKEEQYFRSSAEYKQYFNKIKNRKAIRLKDKNSIKFESISELFENNFLSRSKIFEEFAKHPEEDVAAVIGVKDRFDFRLKNAFESLRNQDYDKNLIKIILVDYGSKDNVSEEIKNLCKEYKVKYVKVSGVKVWNRAHALNVGIKKAGTKYVLCSDVDIIFQKNYISECVKEIKKNPKRLLWSQMFDLPEGAVDSTFDIKDYENLKEEKAVLRSRLMNCPYRYGLSINFILRKYYFQIRGYEENYLAWGCEDDDLIKRLGMIGLEAKDISDQTSFLHQWHEMYEGLDENDKKNIEKNKAYFKNTTSVLRNKKGWGRVSKFEGLESDDRTKNFKIRMKRLKERLAKIGYEKDAKDLAAVCCYFNACHYKVRFSNYKIFRRGMARTGIRLLTVELAFGDDPFELTGFPDVLQLRTAKKNIMWQKERLLNIGIKKLIEEGYKKITWLDADFVFEDDNWVKELSKKLDKYPLVQVFKSFKRQKEKGKDEYSYSSASHYRNTGKITGKEARPGGGWAGRSSILEKVPLYDAAVVTTDNDVLNLYGSFRDGRDLTAIREKYEYFNYATLPYLFHYMKWAKEWSRLIDNRIGYINQKAQALYHGSFKNRRHSERYVVYRRFQFNPEKDIKIGESGVWEWASNKPGLHKEVRDYFFSRNEDE